MKKLLQFGAGNIGRSFIGQLFSAAGYEVVFVDIDEKLISALNEKRGYTVAIRDKSNFEIKVENVRAISTLDTPAVAREMADADICGTAVGPKILPKLFPVIAAALRQRRDRGRGPIDFILCENLRDAARITSEGLKALLPRDFPLADFAGFSETSIGKMVPVVPEKEREKDPLTVYAEAYNTLILDRRALKNGVPDVKGLAPKDNMKAWVDRKSFIHNLGHAALAYFANECAPSMVYTWEAVQDPELRKRTEAVMREAGDWLVRTYPNEFDRDHIRTHALELLDRFGNRSLGDTLQRVGRDLARKLGPEDRVVGALKACHAASLPYDGILEVLAAGVRFAPADQDGRVLENDAAIVRRMEEGDSLHVLQELTGLTGTLLKEAHNAIQHRRICHGRQTQKA